MNNKTLLKRFEGNFKKPATGDSWSQEEKDDFCDLARIVHDAGFDLWRTNVVNEAARFGCKQHGKDAAFVIGVISGISRPTLRLHALAGRIPKLHRVPVTKKVNVRVKKALQDAQKALIKKFGLPDNRTGCWPDAYWETKSNGSSDSEKFSLNPGVLGGSYGDDWEALQKILKDKKLEDSTKEAIVLSRVGQGKFRELVIKRAENKCDVTGLRNTEVLMASHILAWKDCKSTTDRLNPHNGLLLTPNLDKLFDRGFISFSDEGDMLVKSDEDQDLLKKLHSISSSSDTRLIKKPDKEQKRFLKLHRENNNLRNKKWHPVSSD